MPLEKLIKGFRSFRSSYFEENNHYDTLVREGQSPQALVIACSDSRNDPALLTRSEPGDIFVVRNVAAIVPPYQPDQNYHGTSAAIEFAVKGLKVKNIVVLGHALCGGVMTLADEGERGSGSPEYEFLTHWITIGRPARDLVRKVLVDAPVQTRLKALEQAVILTSLNNLMTFPWIRSAVESGDIALHGWYFDMVKGRLLAYDAESGAFTDIKNAVDGLSACPVHPTGGDACCPEWPVEKLVKKHLAKA